MKAIFLIPNGLAVAALMFAQACGQVSPVEPENFAAQNKSFRLEMVAGGCNQLDQLNFINPTNTNFAKQLRSCAKKEMGDANGTVNCLMTVFPSLSRPCSQCFGDAVGCTKDKCWFECMFDQHSADCKGCSVDNCRPSLISCSGVSRENLPHD